MSKLANVKAYITAGHRNKEICELLDVAPAYVATVRGRMRAGAYEEDKDAEPKVADGEYFAHYEQIQREKAAKQARYRDCVRMKVVRGKVMECGKPSHGRPYCSDCRKELAEKSMRRAPAAVIVKA